VVKLEPERLKTEMLFGVAAAPTQGIRIRGSDHLTYFGTNKRYPAKATIAAISLQQQFLFGVRRHTNWEPLVFGQEGHRACCRWPSPWAAFTPKRFAPLADRRYVGDAYQFIRGIPLSQRMRRYCCVEQTSRVKQLRYRIT
jgi:hypothetical protein